MIVNDRNDLVGSNSGSQTSMGQLSACCKIHKVCKFLRVSFFKIDFEVDSLISIHLVTYFVDKIVCRFCLEKSFLYL